MPNPRLLCKMIVLPVLCFLPASQAKCIANDSWHGSDKAMHFALGTFVAGATTVGTESRMTGFLVGVGVGAAKEALDAAGTGTCSFQDFAWTAVGAGVGAWTGGWMLSRQQGKTTISYFKEF